MHSIWLSLKIQFQSKWHCGSGESSLQADRLIRRDARNCPVIPGSTLKGVIRENCEKLSRTLGFPAPADPHQTRLTHTGSFAPLIDVPSPVDAIFGNKYEEGLLFFRDAKLSKLQPYDSFFQSRIRMNKILRTVKEKHLFSSEYAISSTLSISEFTTTIDGYCRNLFCSQPGDPPLAFCLLVAGILAIDRLGGDKSTGCGKLKTAFDSIKFDGNPMTQEDVFEILEYYVGLAPNLLPRESAQKGRKT